MDKLVLKQYNHFQFIEKIYYKNENGKGYRSIGEWIVVRNASTIDPSHYNFNEHQIKHLEKVIEVYDCAVIMKEAYAEKYRIHDPYSFGSWFLANIYGGLVYEDINQLDEKIISIYNTINSHLSIICGELDKIQVLSKSENGRKLLENELNNFENNDSDDHEYYNR